MENGNTNKSLAIYHFLEMQLQLFREHFFATHATMDVEAIHQMRVAIKRIRTIRKLKKYIHFPSLLNAEQYIRLKSIFAVSGQMRDLQIQQKLITIYTRELKVDFEGFAAYLDELESCNQEQLSAAIQTFDVNQFNKPDQSAELHIQLDNGLDLETQSTNFLQLKINKIYGLILLMDRDEFVHNLRKQVKQLFFILQFLKKHFPNSEFSKYKLKSLKDIGEHLGNWNDCEMLIKRLKTFLESKGEAYLEDHAQYSFLLNYLETEKQKILENVDVKLHGEMIKWGNVSMRESQ